MSVLDPNCPNDNVQDQLDNYSLPSGINANHRAFGFLPNIRRLAPGDLILTSGGSSTSPAIARLQAVAYRSTAEWTHAAIYLGGWHMAEAVPVSNVRIAPLHRFVPECKLLLRRPRPMVEKEENLAYLDGLMIAAEAAKRVGAARYGYGEAIRIARAFLGGRSAAVLVASDAENGQSVERFICSELYAKCVQYAIGYPLSWPDNIIMDEMPATPAMLAATPRMVTIDAGWARLPVGAGST